MTRRTRELIILAVALAIVLGVALGGYAVVRARAAGTESRQALAPVKLPTSATPAATPAPQYERWTVGKATGPVVVRLRPSPGAPVKTRLGKVNLNGYPTLVLVDNVREVHGVVWYRVYVAMRPNESRGWVREGQLAFYQTSARIVIDLSQRRLMVYTRGQLLHTYPVDENSAASIISNIAEIATTKLNASGRRRHIAATTNAGNTTARYLPRLVNPMLSGIAVESSAKRPFW
jgi:hypothetical protein